MLYPFLSPESSLLTIYFVVRSFVNLVDHHGVGLRLTILPAWNDVDMKPGTKVVNIMTEKRKLMKDRSADGDDGEILVSIEFPSMMHGWVPRGDTRDPKVVAEQERALQLTADFLQRHTTTTPG